VYAMTVAADEELAMVLPLPLPPASPESCRAVHQPRTLPDLFR
jgi:hypothetical protein